MDVGGGDHSSPTAALDGLEYACECVFPFQEGEERNVMPRSRTVRKTSSFKQFYAIALQIKLGIEGLR